VVDPEPGGAAVTAPAGLAFAVREATADVIVALARTEAAVETADGAGVTWASRRLRRVQGALRQMVPALCGLATELASEGQEAAVEWTVRLLMEDER
jgi:hypothetical protein